MKFKYIKSLYFAGMAIALISCSNSNAEKKIESIEESEEVTAMMEAAFIDGREAGRLYLISMPKDTVEAYNHYLEMRQKYDSLPDKRYLQEYESAVARTRSLIEHPINPKKLSSMGPQ